MSKPFLSIIIPAYNEEQRLPGTLEQVLAFLSSQSYRSEILIVENASQIIGLTFSADEIDQMVKGLNANLENYQKLRQVPLANSVPPAIVFNPEAGMDAYAVTSALFGRVQGLVGGFGCLRRHLVGPSSVG